MKFDWLLLFALFSIPDLIWSQQDYLPTHYRKLDTLIPMRDGKNLYTVIYLPKDETKEYPILMERTPYSAGPYGAGPDGPGPYAPARFPSRLGPNPGLVREGYIFVRQDVRGRYMSDPWRLGIRELVGIWPLHLWNKHQSIFPGQY